MTLEDKINNCKGSNFKVEQTPICIYQYLNVGKIDCSYKGEEIKNDYGKKYYQCKKN